MTDENAEWGSIIKNDILCERETDQATYLEKQLTALPHSDYIKMEPSEYSMTYDEETLDAIRKVLLMLSLRKEFVYEYDDIDSVCVKEREISDDRVGYESTEPVFNIDLFEMKEDLDLTYVMVAGLMKVYKNDELIWSKRPIPTAKQFVKKLKKSMLIAQDPATKTFCYKRLSYLLQRFNIYITFNGSKENMICQKNKHRDFYNIRKVDTHVHHSACMRQNQLLRFIRRKYLNEADTVVHIDDDGNYLTLKDIFKKHLNLTAHDLSIDLLDVNALGSCYHRFDIFSTKYNPFGQRILRSVFLKTDNYMNGRYLAEITNEVQKDLQKRKYTFVEWRISIYGKSYDEWDKLALWFDTFKLSHGHVRWVIQVPRLYHIYKQKGLVENFEQFLKNIFEPVFNAILYPSRHKLLFKFLHQVVAWDSVDDESVSFKLLLESNILPAPDQWYSTNNPPYSYYAYYMYANIRALNELLLYRNMRTMKFRPHCGEAGSRSHLVSMFLLSNGISHGVMLRKIPVLQYLYYLKQIPIAISPFSNNALFLDINKNPFKQFFSVGLNVSISTDDPLMFHFTDEPLIEEYSACAHVWKLSSVDLCEIGRNSVLQSSYDPQLKRHWIGENYNERGMHGNDITKTNLPDIRVQYREDTLWEEFKMLRAVK